MEVWVRRATLCALWAWAANPAGAEEAFVVDAAASSFRISVGKSGLFSFAGHEHQVLATAIEGRIVVNREEAARSSVNLRFETSGLKVEGQGEPAEDVPKVQAKLASPEVLNVVQFPEVTFRSTAVEARQSPDGSWNLRVTGDVTIKGASRSLVLPLRVQLAEGVLTATGQTVLKQREFGITPVSVGGVVKVRNELGLDYKIVARVAP
jgi:polyisoprenoid-binding protein YceI